MFQGVDANINTVLEVAYSLNDNASNRQISVSLKAVMLEVELSCCSKIWLMPR